MLLSLLIPSRNEMFLQRTIDDALAAIEGETEIIVVLDGWHVDLKQDPRVKVIHFAESIGQRAATNAAARASRAKWVMKVDAHCSFDKGFDVKMMAAMEGHDDWTMVPVMKNLHAFDWVCPDGHRRYQSPSGPCKECGKETTMDVVWIAKPSPNSKTFRFDNTLHFQYWKELEKRQRGKEIMETLSIQGSCFMLTREKYWELDICDEAFGSWGQQGVEVACKTWLSGGTVVCNTKTWYAHLFRTQGGDFGFPFPLSGNQIDHARAYSRDLFLKDKWPKAKRSFRWLLDRFAPVPDWTVSKGIVYYTDNEHDPRILDACRNQIKKGFGQQKIVSVSLKHPIHFGENIFMDMKRGPITLFRQILAGLEKIDTDIVFFCESDVLYHPSHFDFVPPTRDRYYYNTNVWKLRMEDGHMVRTDDCRQLSGLCADRELLIKHYRERIRRCEVPGFVESNDVRYMGYEPGTHGRPERIDDIRSERWESEHPNIDIRHNKNMTANRWSPDQFNNEHHTRGWKEADEVSGWGKGTEIVHAIMG